MRRLNLQSILDIAVIALRALLPIYAIIIIYQCFASARRHRRPEISDNPRSLRCDRDVKALPQQLARSRHPHGTQDDCLRLLRSRPDLVHRSCCARPGCQHHLLWAARHSIAPKQTIVSVIATEIGPRYDPD